MAHFFSHLLVDRNPNSEGLSDPFDVVCKPKHDFIGSGILGYDFPVVVVSKVLRKELPWSNCGGLPRNMCRIVLVH